MNAFSITFDWIDFGCHDNPLIDGTFANVCIKCGDSVVTQVHDKKARTIRDFISVPLYPLVEWLTANWWALFYECDALGKAEAREPFSYRHSLRVAEEGFALPDLRICSEGDEMLLAWHPSLGSYQNIDFIGQGACRMPTAAVDEVFASLVDAVLGRLAAKKIDSSWLAREWAVIQNSDSQENSFCSAAGWLGLIPYSMDETIGREILSVWNRLSRGLRRDVFCAASSDTLRDVGQWVEDVIGESGVAAGEAHPWKGLFNSTVTSDSHTPWEIGYKLAVDARRRFGLEIDDVVDPEKLPDMKMQFTQTRNPPIPSVQGLFCFRDHREAVCFTARQRSESRRFLAARGLMGWLYGEQDVVSLLSTTLDRRQRQQRAFAAEFLVPAEALKQRITTHRATEDQVVKLAEHFGVSDFVILHQLKNHHIAEPPD